jgi:hypothetical protein
MLSNPDTLGVISVHMSDGYETAWGDYRFFTWYGQTAIPNVWLDGLARTWDPPADFTVRQAVPTDVTIEQGATQLADATWLVTANICLEPDGTAKDLRVSFGPVLDFYPTGDTYSRNCLRQMFDSNVVSVGPGACVGVQQSITFDATSWANQSDIRIVTWAEELLPTGPAEVHQADQIEWPLPATEHPVYANGMESGAPDSWDAVQD